MRSARSASGLPDRRVCWRCGEVRALFKEKHDPRLETCRDCIDKKGRMFAYYLGRAIYSASRLAVEEGRR